MKRIFYRLTKAKRKGYEHLFVGLYKDRMVTYWGKSFCYGEKMDLTMQKVLETDTEIKGFLLANITKYLNGHEEERKKFIQKLYERDE